MEADAAVLSEVSNNTDKETSPSQEEDQKVPEIHLQEDEVSNDCDPEEQKDKNTRTKDFLKTGQRDRQSLTPLGFLKEDFSQFKEEVLKVFRDKDTNPSENKAAARTLDLLREDLSQFKEDVTSVFSSSKETKSTDPKTSQSAEKTINRLSFLNFKDDVSNVFRIGLPKDRDNTAKEDSSNTFKIKAERTEEPFLQSLFSRTSLKTENIQEVEKTFSETSKEQMDTGFRGNPSEQNRETVDAETINNVKDATNEVEDSEVDSTVSEEKTTSLSETQQSEETLKVFRDKDTNPSENKAAARTLDLMKEDLSQFKEDGTSTFSSSKETKSTDPKTSQSAEKTINRLSFLNFKDDLSNVFRIGLPKDRDNKKEDSSKMFKIKAERTEEPFLQSLFSRTSLKTENTQEAKKTFSETSKEQMDTGFRGNPSEQNRETVDAETINDNVKDATNEVEDSEVDSTVSEEKMTSLSETQQSEETLKVFRDKDTNPSENKAAARTLDLLKEDLSQFKEDGSSIFSSSKETKSTDPKTSQSAEKTINRLSFLNFKDDLSNVFRIGLPKDRDNKKEDSSKMFKIKAERTEEPFLQSLFSRTSLKTENTQEVEKTFSETSKEQTDAGLKGTPSEQNGETVEAETIDDNVKDGTNEVEDSEVDTTVSEEKTTSLSETQQSEETIPASQAAEQRCESEKWSDDSSVVSAEDERIDEEKEKEKEKEKEEDGQEDKEEPSETLPWEALSSGIHLFSLRDTNKEDMRGRPGADSWSLKNFACYLTFDPNTANSELHLSDCNRKATRVWSDQRPSEHPDRFERCPQVLCREGLLDSVYWEVVWSGGADIGVTYNNISRDGDAASCLLGHNEQSWSLECSEGCYTPCHRNKRFRSSSPRPFTHRVGVYLDWTAGSLSFYCVSQDAMVLLHTFTSSFTEPLYPGFWVWAYDGSVSLCQVELDWERLLQ